MDSKEKVHICDLPNEILDKICEAAKDDVQFNIDHDCHILDEVHDLIVLLGGFLITVHINKTTAINLRFRMLMTDEFGHCDISLLQWNEFPEFPENANGEEEFNELIMESLPTWHTNILCTHVLDEHFLEPLKACSKGDWNTFSLFNRNGNFIHFDVPQENTDDVCGQLTFGGTDFSTLAAISIGIHEPWCKNTKAFKTFCGDLLEAIQDYKHHHKEFVELLDNENEEETESEDEDESEEEEDFNDSWG